MTLKNSLSLQKLLKKPLLKNKKFWSNLPSQQEVFLTLYALSSVASSLKKLSKQSLASLAQ